MSSTSFSLAIALADLGTHELSRPTLLLFSSWQVAGMGLTGASKGNIGIGTGCIKYGDHIRNSILGGSWGLSKWVNNRDDWGYCMAYRGYEPTYEVRMTLRVVVRSPALP